MRSQNIEFRGAYATRVIQGELKKLNSVGSGNSSLVKQIKTGIYNDTNPTEEVNMK